MGGWIGVVAVAGTSLAACSDDSGDDAADDTPTDGAAPASPAIPFVEASVVASDEGFTVAWAADVADAVTVYATTDPAGGDRDHQVGEGGQEDQLTVTDLPAAPRWYFELVPDAGEPLVVADRSLHLASAPNLRDVGGYRTEDGRWVRMGLVFRSDGIDELSDADRATLEAVGVRLVCDLRTAYERDQTPDILPGGAEGLVLDVLADGEDVSRAVTEAILSGDSVAQDELLGEGAGRQLMIDGGAAYVSLPSARDSYSRMFRRFSDPESLPAMFHCSAGKDRTGWGTAALLSVLGVPRETVVADYLASNDYLAGSIEETLAQAGALVDPALLEPVLAVDEAYQQSSFDTVEAEYGTIVDYAVEGLGLDEATIEALRDQLLTP